MLVVHESCLDKFIEVVKFAAENNLLDNFLDKLDYLRTYANREGCTYAKDEGKDTRCTLYADFAPYSFEFGIQKFDGKEWSGWFGGGLIYSGPEQPLNGSGPAFTVGIGTPKVGWSIHT